MDTERKKWFSFTKKDFRVDTFKCGGKGGQNQNKRDTGVRITHTETGLVSECRVHRTQLQNKKEAFHKLCEKLVEHYRKIDFEEKRPINKEVIRTYHFEDDRIVDHDSGKQYSCRKTFGKGKYPFIEDRLMEKAGDD